MPLLTEVKRWDWPSARDPVLSLQASCLPSWEVAPHHFTISPHSVEASIASRGCSDVTHALRFMQRRSSSGHEAGEEEPSKSGHGISMAGDLAMARHSRHPGAPCSFHRDICRRNETTRQIDWCREWANPSGQSLIGSQGHAWYAIECADKICPLPILIDQAFLRVGVILCSQTGATSA